MAVVKSSFNLDVNSDPAGGAKLLNPAGTQFEINLEQPISIPSGAFNPTIRVEEATVWNTVFNVSEELGNNHIYINDGGGGLDNLTIDDGTYSTSELSEAINRVYTDPLTFNGTLNLVTLQEDFPTQKVVLVLRGTLAGGDGIVTVDFTFNDTFRDLIGFVSSIKVSPANEDISILADNVAAFNNIEYFLIHWDGGQGIRTNNTYNQTIARVNITAAPGSQIVSQPFNPARSSAQGWVGTTKNNLVFWLTDQNNKLADTGETWSARLVFEWEQMVQSSPGTTNV